MLNVGRTVNKLFKGCLSYLCIELKLLFEVNFVGLAGILPDT